MKALLALTIGLGIALTGCAVPEEPTTTYYNQTTNTDPVTGDTTSRITNGDGSTTTCTSSGGNFNCTSVSK